jgi:hypothetical protein
MPRKTSNGDPIAAYRREVTAQRRVGENTECACGENRPLALIRKGDSVMCAACTRTVQGKTPMDKNHVAGKANHPLTMEVPVNDHRAWLSEAQSDWPKATLENPHGSVLLAAAGCIRGFVDKVIYLLENLLLWIANMLEALDAHMTEQHGPQWWLDTPLALFAWKGIKRVKR